MKTDVEIAQAAIAQPIQVIASKLKIDANDLELYGKDKAKIAQSGLQKAENNKKGKLVLVTAMTPTKAGEGKSTTTIGLLDGLASLNQSVVACLREPSLGPVFGVKGGATGGGLAQVIPMVDINLHFTGDMHAITAANNLVSAVLDNHIFQGNVLNINPESIVWTRCMDMNDRALRSIEVSMNETKVASRKDAFVITVASPMMAMMCLSKDLEDFRRRVQRTIIAYTYKGQPITIQQLGCDGAVAVLMKDAIKPNLVQSLEGNPVLIHGGPFANIAHGSNSIIATRLGLKLADIVVTEAGFGSDLGAQKFMDITSRAGEFNANAVVLVATVRALKMHGGVLYDHLKEENIEALRLGLENLAQHIQIIQTYQVPLVVALNRFYSDTDAEINIVKDYCASLNIAFEVNESWEKGSIGAQSLALSVVNLLNQNNEAKSLFVGTESLTERIEKIATTIYGAKDVNYSNEAQAQLKQLKDLGYGHLNVCIAKTQSSLSDNPKALRRPTDFTLNIQRLNLSSGSDFVVAIAGQMMTMPGLSKDPAALHMDILSDGTILGLF